ncbi:GNAT family N-acetyltransferase [Paraflavitalea sp. CAU 1676]|uniref:GNAT family N-acetyltransferase n=1 Tax=Paraflavitalea sp. CAU 1676 TaxID=3032598 RepID=UPI0023DAA0E3|nr:GNAT family N-acetyltransferase [Paraflavitalea sp. CAU 1676]MDF2191521.1 GNAT family N-acetyltransferase [Paraflavitalea sp. CAU 1676]
MLPEIEYRIAQAAIEFEDGRKLFEEYVASLGVDLSFQDFSQELQVIDRQYNQPEGALLLAYQDGVAIACAGVRKLDDSTAELKRMYVRDGFKGQGIGVQLMQRSLQVARERGYRKIRLDTLKTMIKAQALYRSFGFYEIPSYRYNPLEGAVYMEKEL